MVSLSRFPQSCNPTLNPGVIRCLRMWVYLSEPGHPVHPKNSQGCSWAGLLLQGTSVVFQEGQSEVGGGVVYWFIRSGSRCRLQLPSTPRAGRAPWDCSPLSSNWEGLEESCIGKGRLIRTRRSWTAPSPEPNCLGASLVSP